MIKRLFDMGCASIGLLFTSPIIVAIITAYRLGYGGEGPVFYRGVRVGRQGKLFHMLKFRSMVANAEQLGGSSTADTDPRITPMGKFLRKTKLDELPQLINVIKGDMSLVGPRPEVEYYIGLLSDEQREKILSVRPGITDWASIWNPDEGAVLAGAEDPDKAYLELIWPEKIRLQLAYVHRQSFVVDLKIILQTLAKLGGVELGSLP